jgi:DNA-binding NarL/FixJ family response regulator
VGGDGGKDTAERRALAAALAKISAPTFFVAPDGSIELANGAAIALLERRKDALRRALAGESKSADITVIPSGNANAERKLVVIHPSSPPPAPAPRDRELERRWKLSPRQAEVLGLVVRGNANKDIAAQLEIAEGTVEAHVTAIMRKAGVETRARLAAKYWAAAGEDATKAR